MCVYVCIPFVFPLWSRQNQKQEEASIRSTLTKRAPKYAQPYLWYQRNAKGRLKVSSQIFIYIPPFIFI